MVAQSVYSLDTDTDTAGDNLDGEVRWMLTPKGYRWLRRSLLRALLASSDPDEAVMLPNVDGEYRRMTRPELLAALAYLHPRTRHVVQLVLINRCDRQTAATMLHVSLSTVARALRDWWDISDDL